MNLPSDQAPGSGTTASGADANRPRPYYQARSSNVELQHARIRAIGWMIAFGPIMVAMARLYAARVYLGSYTLDGSRIGQLGARACGPLSGSEAPTEVCSPGFFIFNGSLVLTGVLLLTASLMCEQLRMGLTVLHPLLDARVTRLIGAGGVALGLIGLAPLDLTPVVHDVLLGVLYLVAWTTLAVTFIVIVGARAAFGVTVTGWAFIITTAVMMFISCVSTMMFLVTSGASAGGVFQRISLDSLGLWLLFFGITVIVTGTQRYQKVTGHDA